MIEDSHRPLGATGNRNPFPRTQSGCLPGTIKQVLPPLGSAPPRRSRSSRISWSGSLRRHWWVITIFVALVGSGSYYIAKHLTPLYESTSTVEVNYQQPTGVIGPDALRPLPSNDTDEFLSTQAKLASSDNVIRPVVEKYRLLELEKQVVGGDTAANQRVRGAPIVLRRLRISRQTGTQLLQISYQSPDAILSANVVNELADNYVNRVFELRSTISASLSSFMERQLEQLKSKMDQSNETLSRFERDLGIINPQQRTTVLSARLLQLTAEYTTVQGERVKKEATVNAVLSGAPDAAQISALGDSLSKLDDKRLAARAVLAAAAATLARNHPDYRRAKAEVDELDRQFEETRKSINSRIGTDFRESVARENLLENQIKKAKADYDAANKNAFEYEQVKREADDDRVMYGELLRKVRESNINAGFQNHSLRTTELGRPASKPISPNVPAIVFLSVVVSTLFAASCLIAFSAFDGTLRDAVGASDRLSIQVLGSLPLVSAPYRTTLLESVSPTAITANKRSVGQLKDILAYEEAICKLRNTLDVTTTVLGVRSLLITSSMPNEGKSMTAADVALSFARQSKRTLLIDADLRCPVLHQRLDLPNCSGVADILAGTDTWQACLQTVQNLPSLSVLTAGKPVVSPADTVGSNFGELLSSLHERFDLIVVNAPPMLPFAEPIKMAACVDAVLVVARSGKTTAAAVDNVLSTLEWVSARVLGIVLSQVPRNNESETYEKLIYKCRHNTPTHTKIRVS